ncbi:hypothetical protein [Halocatena pleomorpha]|uniref:Uncharacterized protein n=1 Tax=Halocatena pleomorpha TaxID=1785090 RepID=A0A3P3R778_9EURY|nr:hypothetical protein [Halocatena pleomorpha]RRJ28789.1 hypothetical protein EIK79_14795 [Halocatena pleomorpha]
MLDTARITATKGVRPERERAPSTPVRFPNDSNPRDGSAVYITLPPFAAGSSFGFGSIPTEVGAVMRFATSNVGCMGLHQSPNACARSF